jgi:hypothetical protein
MLLHLVCFKYKAGTDAAARAAHRDRLETLRTLDTGLSITFKDRAALDAYAVDPRHVPISQYGATLSEHIVSCDFEI